MGVASDIQGSGGDDGDDITFVEFERVKDEIREELQEGVATVDAQELARRANVSDAKVYESLSFLSRKHDHVRDIGEGAWVIRSDSDE